MQDRGSNFRGWRVGKCLSSYLSASMGDKEVGGEGNGSNLMKTDEVRKQVRSGRGPTREEEVVRLRKSNF